MATSVQQFVKDLTEIAARMQGEIAGKLVNNVCGSMEDYKHQTGIAKGINMLSTQAYELMKRGDLDDGPNDQLGQMPQTPDGETH